MEPLRGLIHGSPGTGKSQVIKLISRFFVEALSWEHGVEFLCVAFQNRIAFAMGGTTLHNAADITYDGDRKLDKTDIDILFTNSQHLRFQRGDDIFMDPDELLGSCTIRHTLSRAFQ